MLTSFSSTATRPFIPAEYLSCADHGQHDREPPDGTVAFNTDLRPGRCKLRPNSASVRRESSRVETCNRIILLVSDVVKWKTSDDPSVCRRTVPESPTGASPAHPCRHLGVLQRDVRIDSNSIRTSLMPALRLPI